MPDTTPKPEWEYITAGLQRIRIPGGWIYDVFGSEGEPQTAVFVPLAAVMYEENMQKLEETKREGVVESALESQRRIAEGRGL